MLPSFLVRTVWGVYLWGMKGEGELRYFAPGVIFRETRRGDGTLRFPASVCWRLDREGKGEIWGRCLCVQWRMWQGWQLHPRGPSLRRFDRVAVERWELTEEHEEETDAVPELEEDE